MSALVRNPLAALHVLTLNGARGEYGGPIRVARELCIELQRRGYSTQIFTGILSNSIPESHQELKESAEEVSPLNNRFPVSSLWSNRLPKRLFRLINASSIVHIHFARDLISVLTAFICVLLKKPYFTQTHGMIIQDRRLLTRAFDFLFTRPALKHSQVNFVLSLQELAEISSLNFKCRMEILPNGIRIPRLSKIRSAPEIPNVIFCSRLQARKRPDRFLELAKFARKNGIEANFAIYGPDGGALKEIELRIQSDAELSHVKYGGALSSIQVLDLLSESDLLVLPSENEPFPMIVLEALSVGTPTLIMPSCGIAQILKNKFPEFVASSDDDQGIISAFNDIFNIEVMRQSRDEYRSFCEEQFGIDKVVDLLEQFYFKADASK